MRRGIAASALVASLALTATACGGSGSDSKSDGPVTITWWDTSNATNEAPTYKALVKDFEAANKGVKVNYVNVQFDQAQNKFDTAAQSGKGAPDVLRSEVGWTPAFAKAGYFLPLDGTGALADQATFQSSLITQAQYDGKTYGVPLVTDTLALVYNKALLKKAGITEAPKTWDELKTDAAKVQDKARVTGYWGPEAAYYTQPFLYGEGTDMVDASAKKITITSAAAKKGYQTWLDLYSGKGLQKADTTADAYAHRQDAFVNGKVAMTLEGPWEITNFYKGSAFGDKSNLGITTVPAGSAGKAGAPTGGHNLSVYAGSDKAHQEAALKFVAFMTSAKSQTEIALKNSTLPTRSDAFTAEVKADPGIAGYQAVLSSAQPRPALAEYSSLWGPVGTELAKVAGGKESLDKGLGNAELGVEKLVPDFSK